MVMCVIGLESDTQVGLLAICSFYTKTNIVNTHLCILTIFPPVLSTFA